MVPLATITVKKLQEHVRYAEDRLLPIRHLRLAAFREMWGRYYYRDDGVARHLNLIRRAMDTIIPALATSDPEHFVETDDVNLRGEALVEKAYLDHISRDIDRSTISRKILQDAFLGPRGVVRCGLKVGPDIIRDSNQLDLHPGRASLQYIDFDDFVCDPRGAGPGHWRWQGHYFTVGRDILLDSGIYPNHIVERLPAVQDSVRAHQQQRVQDEASGSTQRWEKYSLFDEVEILTIALYDDQGCRYIVDLPADHGYDSEEFLRVDEWNGLDRGPYEHLEFCPINGQPHGMPPVSAWRELGDAFHVLVDKWIEQVKRTKRLIAAAKNTSEDDLDTIRESEDGEVILLDDLSNVDTLEYGGQSQDLVPAIHTLYSFFNTAANNPDILSGAGSQTDKVGIFQGLQAGAIQILDDHKSRHMAFEERLSEHLLFYARNDPLMDKGLTYRLPGGEYMNVRYRPEQRRGDWGQTRFRIVQHSMGPRNPELKARRMVEFMQSLLMAAEVSMQTGGMIDVSGYARLGGEALGIRELQHIVRDQQLDMERALLSQMGPQQMQGVPAGEFNINPPRGLSVASGRGGASGSPGHRDFMTSPNRSLPQMASAGGSY